MDAELRLVLVRHAIAEEQGPAWPDDEQRPLSREGVRKWKIAARGLAAQIDRVEALLTSPLVRTCQTAEMLSRALTPSPRLSLFEALRPDSGPATVISALKARGLSGTAILVGHEPLLSELASTLLHLQGPLEFRKGGAMALTSQGLGARGPARLEWFLTPKQLREMGERA